MKNFIVPFDFSDCANSALNYAAALAKRAGKAIVLVHSHSAFLPTADSRYHKGPFEELQHISQNALEKRANEIHAQYGIETHAYASPHALGSIVKEAMHKFDAELVIMGMKGYNKLKRNLLGSNTLSIIEHHITHVLAVPEDYAFEEPKDIMIAVDYKQSDARKFDILYDLLVLFSSKLHLVKVYEDLSEANNAKEAKIGLALHHKFEAIPHEFEYVHANSVNRGLENYIHKQKPGMVCMIPREHTFFERMFKHTHTEEVAIEAHRPVLALV